MLNENCSQGAKESTLSQFQYEMGRALLITLVTKTRVSNGGRAGEAEPWALAHGARRLKACGSVPAAPTRVVTEAPAGVTLQYVEEADGAQRRVWTGHIGNRIDREHG